MELLTTCHRTDAYWMDGGAGQLHFLLQVQHPMYFFLLENVAIRGLSEVKRQTPGQLHSEVEAGGGR